MENKLYKIADNLHNMLNIEEIIYTRITDSYYWNIRNQRNAINTSYYKCFETKNEAINYAKSKLESNLYFAETSVNRAKEELDKFNNFYQCQKLE